LGIILARRSSKERGDEMGECLFCKIIAEEIPSKKVYEDDILIAIEDIDPQAPTHLLLIPKKHIPNSLALREEDKELIGSIFLIANQLAKERGIAETGFRLVINCNAGAGQSIFHIHFHLLGGRHLLWPPG